MWKNSFHTAVRKLDNKIRLTPVALLTTSDSSSTKELYPVASMGKYKI